MDQEGNTPLHRAVVGEHSDSINLLLNHGADSSVLNEDHMAPIHLAVDVNALKSLKVFDYIHVTPVIISTVLEMMFRVSKQLRLTNHRSMRTE